MQGPIARFLGEKLVGVEVPRNEEDGSFTKDSIVETLTLVMKEDEGKTYRDKAKEMTTIVKLIIVEMSFNVGLVLLTIVKLMGSDDVELGQKKWPRGTFLLVGRSREDHINGPPRGTNNFSCNSFNISHRLNPMLKILTRYLSKLAIHVLQFLPSISLLFSVFT